MLMGELISFLELTGSTCKITESGMVEFSGGLVGDYHIPWAYLTWFIEGFELGKNSTRPDRVPPPCLDEPPEEEDDEEDENSYW